MKRMLALWIVPGLIALNTFGQSTSPGADAELKSLDATLSDLASSVQQPFLKKYMEKLKAATSALAKQPSFTPDKLSSLRNEITNLAKLASDTKGLLKDSPWQQTPFMCYVVPAISAIRRVPNTLPPDGKMGNEIKIIAAQGEFEPASFVLAPLEDTARLDLKASELAGDKGMIPSECIDIKVVKCWWQPGTAWNSYFADVTRRELVPDLLLKDETLIKVDMEKKEHYLRVDYPEGPEYVWISYQYPESSKIEREHRFDYFKEPVADSPCLLPASLKAGQNKQFWVTVKIPEKTVAGIYEGRIALTADGVPAGEIALKVRVLPFFLPDPKTYYDLNLDFISSMDDLGSLKEELKEFDKNWELAEKRLRVLYKNQREHNIFNYNGPHILSWNKYEMHQAYCLANVMDNEESRQVLTRQLELVKEAGFKPPLIAPTQADISCRVKMNEKEGKEIFDRNIEASKKLLDLVEKVLGHRDVYFWGRGEPSRGGLIEELEGFKALHGVGVKIGQEAQPWHFSIAGHLEDLVNMGGAYYDRKITAPWHALGQRVVSYASPHPGAENPDMARRMHGMMLYKSWFDGTKNNTWNSRRQNWLDFWNPYGYRITMIYPTRNGVIDTLSWEAFREGIDDIRYATKLKMLARQAIASGNAATAEEAKKALLWLELHDEKSADLNAMRMEMINYILKLNAML